MDSNEFCYKCNPNINKKNWWKETGLCFTHTQELTDEIMCLKTRLDEVNKLKYHPELAKRIDNIEELLTHICLLITNKKQSKTKKINLEKVSKFLRRKILERDNYTCQNCGYKPEEGNYRNLHIDHIIPKSKGGKAIISNLRTLCYKCNLMKREFLFNEIVFKDKQINKEDSIKVNE